MAKQRILGRRRFNGLLQLGYVGYQGRAFAAAGAVRKGGGWEVLSKRRGREELVSGVSPFLASVGIFAAFLLPVSLAADAGGAAGTEDTGATGATSTVVGIGALASARGHEKLSARPAGA